jgi:hypothetical protein
MRVRCRRTTDVSCCARRDPNRLMTASGTTVWTGRALQAESDDLEVIGLALLYPALERNVCVPGHHGYPRASDLILGKAQRGRSCHQITDATARPFLHLFISARRPRRESQLLLSGSASDVGGGGHPLSRRGLRYARLIAALLCQHGPSDPRQLVRPKRSDAGAERRERARVRSRASVHLVPPTVVGSSNMSGMNTIPGMACINHDQYDIDRGIAETVQAL